MLTALHSSLGSSVPAHGAWAWTWTWLQHPLTPRGEWGSRVPRFLGS